MGGYPSSRKGKEGKSQRRESTPVAPTAYSPNSSPLNHRFRRSSDPLPKKSVDSERGVKVLPVSVPEAAPLDSFAASVGWGGDDTALKERTQQQPPPSTAPRQPLRTVEMAQEVPFMPFGVLAKLNMFPRFGTPHCQARPRSSYDDARTLFIMLSHRWLSPSEDPQHSHPDLPFNGSPKFKLLMELLTRIKLKLPPDFQIAIWMDWMCLEQGTDTAKELGDSLQGIIAASDLLVTVVYDSEHQKWKYPELVSDWMVDYKAQGWNGSSESHLQRAWCRLEASISAVTPLPTNDDAWKQKCKALEHHALGYMMKCGRRPHILFGTKEMSDKLPLIVLPPLLEPHLMRYAPRLATRNITLKQDAAVIMQYSQKLEGAPPVVQPGIVELDRGCVQITDEDGAIYTGGWNGSVKNGTGEMVFADGNVYDGEWVNGEMHGKGKYLYATGDVYKGDFREGKMHGTGTYNWADGYVYDGEWVDDKMHGMGTFALNNGFSVVTLFNGKWWHGSST